jgi:hypothetical protein
MTKKQLIEIYNKFVGELKGKKATLEKIDGGEKFLITYEDGKTSEAKASTVLKTWKLEPIEEKAEEVQEVQEVQEVVEEAPVQEEEFQDEEQEEVPAEIEALHQAGLIQNIDTQVWKFNANDEFGIRYSFENCNYQVIDGDGDLVKAEQILEKAIKLMVLNNEAAKEEAEEQKAEQIKKPKAEKAPARAYGKEEVISFLQDVLKAVKEKMPGFTKASKVSNRNYIYFSAGKTGLSIVVTVKKELVETELYIDGKTAKEDSEKLEKYMTEIHQELFGIDENGDVLVGDLKRILVGDLKLIPFDGKKARLVYAVPVTISEDAIEYAAQQVKELKMVVDTFLI